MLEPGQAQRQDGHQALPAREYLGLVAELREQGQRLLQRLRRVVLEGGGLHLGARGMPRMRWDTMLRWICSVPPYTLAGRDRK